MSTLVQMKWTEGMAFEAEVTGHRIIFDADETVGGKDLGPRPKAMVLGSLGGCTGMDVVSLLKKMRVDFDDFEMSIEADLTEEYPKVYNRIMIRYIFYGDDLPLDKIEKAVNLSQEKYCGVSAMLRSTAKLEYLIELRKKA